MCTSRHPHHRRQVCICVYQEKGGALIYRSTRTFGLLASINTSTYTALQKFLYTYNVTLSFTDIETTADVCPLLACKVRNRVVRWAHVLMFDPDFFRRGVTIDVQTTRLSEPLNWHCVLKCRKSPNVITHFGQIRKSLLFVYRWLRKHLKSPEHGLGINIENNLNYS